MGADGLHERLIVEHVGCVDSTNSELLRRDPLLPDGSPAEALLLVAASQTAGRGRRQRSWVSTPAASLTASFAREVPRPSHLGALSLVSGLAVAQTLDAFGVNVRLKWPNDLHAHGGKAGGILCEARARGGVTRLVIGFGLNLLVPEANPRTAGDDQRTAGVDQRTDGVDQRTASGDQRTTRIDQQVAGLFSLDALPDRCLLAAAIGRSLLAATDRLFEQGFESFRQEWSARDMLLSRPITIHDAAGLTDAVALGIDGEGALLVQVSGNAVVRRLLAEEVSVRTQEP